MIITNIDGLEILILKKFRFGARMDDPFDWELGYENLGARKPIPSMVFI